MIQNMAAYSYRAEASSSTRDHVIPLYVPQCKECECCRHPRANLCTKISFTQSHGVMPDGTTRFTCRNKTIHHFMGVSSFSQYTVLPEIAVAKINPLAPLDRVCLLGCGVSSGYGAATNMAHITRDSTVAVWGLGAIAVRSRPSRGGGWHHPKAFDAESGHPGHWQIRSVR
ncbi:hypothetical protein MTO96_049733 [Rhipicephalus appendiculatus]